MKYLLLLALVACQSFPEKDRRFTDEQCSVNFIYDLVQIANQDGTAEPRYVIDESKSFCRCRRYRLSLKFIGPIANSSSDKPLRYCDKLIGETPVIYGKKNEFLQSLRSDLEYAAGRK